MQNRRSTLRELHVLADLAIVFVLLLHVAGILGIGGSGEAVAHPPVTPAKPGSGNYGSGGGVRLCFPKRSWDAAQRYRPCISLVRVEEDGSFVYAAEDFDGTVRYTAVVGAKDR